MDDQVDAVHVDATGRDVGRDHHTRRAGGAERLVRVKISDRFLPPARAATTLTRSAGATVSTRWTMAAGAAATESTACRAGSLRKRRTRTSTSLSRVAENNIRRP